MQRVSTVIRSRVCPRRNDGVSLWRVDLCSERGRDCAIFRQLGSP